MKIVQMSSNHLIDIAYDVVSDDLTTRASINGTGVWSCQLHDVFEYVDNLVTLEKSYGDKLQICPGFSALGQTYAVLYTFESLTELRTHHPELFI